MGRRNDILDQLFSQTQSMPYQSNLSPADSFAFARWASENNVPADLSKSSDYDMPGFFKSGKQSQVSPLDGRPHYTDEFKTPLHQTLSAESKYAPPGAPSWQGNSLRTPGGQLSAMELPGGTILKVAKNQPHYHIVFKRPLGPPHAAEQKPLAHEATGFEQFLDELSRVEERFRLVVGFQKKRDVGLQRDFRRGESQAVPSNIAKMGCEQLRNQRAFLHIPSS